MAVGQNPGTLVNIRQKTTNQSLSGCSPTCLFERLLLAHPHIFIISSSCIIVYHHQPSHLKQNQPSFIIISHHQPSHLNHHPITSQPSHHQPNPQPSHLNPMVGALHHRAQGVQAARLPCASSPALRCPVDCRRAPVPRSTGRWKNIERYPPVHTIYMWQAGSSH